MEITEENNNIAFNIVRERFNNHSRFVYSHVIAILNSKFENVKSFINTIDRHVLGLQGLNVPLQNYLALLIPLLVSILDNEFIRDWERNISSLSNDVLPTYNDFRDFLLVAETNDIIKVSTTNTQDNGKFRTSSY